MNDRPDDPARTRVLLTTKKFSVVESHDADRDGKPLVRQWVRHPGSIVILPLTDDGKVCLIRNRRFAVGDTLVELPAGTLDPGEDPAETARRELIEETGYRAESIRPIHSFYLSPGILQERMHFFLATGLQAGEPRREPGEQIENLVVPWTEAIDLVAAGQIVDAKTLVGLLWYGRFLRAGD